jgi:phosphate transport system substrate-binding protein
MRNWCLFLILGIIWGCQGKENKRPSIYEGKINVAMDESIMPLIQAETDGYKMHYPKAGFETFVMPETQAVKWLLSDSMDVICITRLLNEEEMAIVNKREIKYIPAPMALDAVVLITHPDSDLKQLSLDELKDLFKGKGRKLVFDVGSSSNLNHVLSTLGIKEFDKDAVVAAGSNLKVFDFVKKDKSAIGFVGFNMISEKSNEGSVELRNSVKILSVDGIAPSKGTIVEQVYPFHRTIYLHTLGTAWGVENGFIRFACTKPGQLIAEKMGLVPYYAIPKEFYLSKEDLQ